MFLVGFIIRIYDDARSSECQILIDYFADIVMKVYLFFSTGLFYYFFLPNPPPGVKTLL